MRMWGLWKAILKQAHKQVLLGFRSQRGPSSGTAACQPLPATSPGSNHLLPNATMQVPVCGLNTSASQPCCFCMITCIMVPILWLPCRNQLPRASQSDFGDALLPDTELGLGQTEREEEDTLSALPPQPAHKRGLSRHRRQPSMSGVLQYYASSCLAFSNRSCWPRWGA